MLLTIWTTIATDSIALGMKHEIIRIGQIGIKFLLESVDTNGSMAISTRLSCLNRYDAILDII